MGDAFVEHEQRDGNFVTHTLLIGSGFVPVVTFAQQYVIEVTPYDKDDDDREEEDPDVAINISEELAEKLIAGLNAWLVERRAYRQNETLPLKASE